MRNAGIALLEPPGMGKGEPWEQGLSLCPKSCHRENSKPAQGWLAEGTPLNYPFIIPSVSGKMGLESRNMVLVLPWVRVGTGWHQGGHGLGTWIGDMEWERGMDGPQDPHSQETSATAP